MLQTILMWIAIALAGCGSLQAAGRHGRYLRVVANFAKHFGKSPDKLGLDELRTYQAHLLKDRKLTPGTVGPA